MQLFKRFKEFTASCPACDKKLTHVDFPCPNCKRAKLKLVVKQRGERVYYDFGCEHCETYWQDLYCPTRSCRARIDDKFFDFSNCYLATAVFGYDHPMTTLLRRFRDGVLVKLPGGKRFVFWYYKWSPRLLRWLGKEPID
jgi:hypothetical protein